MFISPLLDDRMRRWCSWLGIRETSCTAIVLGQHRSDAATLPQRLSIADVCEIQVEEIIRLGQQEEISALHIDAPELTVRGLVTLLSRFPKLQEVSVSRLDWSRPSRLPDQLSWTFEQPPELMLESLPVTSRSMNLKRASLTRRLCDRLSQHRTDSLCLEHCEDWSDVSPWDASTLDEVSFYGVSATLVDRAIEERLNISSLGVLRGIPNVEIAEVLMGLRHLEVCYGDALFEALQHSDEILDALRSLRVTGHPVGVTSTATLSHILRRSTNLSALALYRVPVSSENLEDIPWYRLEMLSLGESEMKGLCLPKKEAPNLQLLDISNTHLHNVLDSTMNYPRLIALFAEGTGQLDSFAGCLPHSALRFLDLSFCSLTSNAAEALFHEATFPSLNAVKMLHLYQSIISLDRIAEWSASRPLKLLDLYEFAGSSQALGEAVRENAQTLQVLTLGNGTNVLGAIDAIEDKEFLALRCLKMLYALHQEDLGRLFRALRGTPLQHLTIELRNDAALDVLLKDSLLTQLHTLSISGPITDSRDLDPDFILELLIASGASPLLTLAWDYEGDG